ncbi:Growth-regulating factor [Heracleum sosnowskyi]|uniref:Growth-regulating factor n=1 Tax=Heracleum sosnowskyi TaxID=360622 RepID=A0AAD8IPA8_9APIA|nr:Growth-regulating factor [Heracleum sosnowskyi]
MDLEHLKQWTEHQQKQKHEAEQQSDLTRLLLNDCYYQQHHSNCSELPLFTSPADPTKLNLHTVPTSSTRMMGTSSYFSMGQWQELEVQACIFRHMIAGAPIPPQLVHLVKKSLILNSHNSYPYYHSSPYQAALLQSGGYWGRGAMDPEPGRCRRTDGKKWRCSRDVVGGYKYCDRHMHRGRNRSRKPVEIPTPSSTASNNNISTINNSSGALITSNTNQAIAAQAPTATTFGLSRPSHSFDLLHLNHRSSETVTEATGLYRTPKTENDLSGSQVLRPFFNDWPRSVQESENSINNDRPGTSLSISVPGNPLSDFSLKLSTGASGGNHGPEANVEREQPQLEWGSSTSPWGMNQMGGPLAEALRSSSTPKSSPKSVLHQLPGAANFIST